METGNKCRCGAESNPQNYIKCETRTVMESKQLCYTCAYWEIQASKKHETVIAGRIYGIGNGRGGFKGMAGRRFDIEYFDGRRVTTNDLWAGSEVPEYLKERIPDTARFINGAAEAKVGGVTCWIPSEAPK